jgi:hypothetical protein
MKRDGLVFLKNITAFFALLSMVFIPFPLALSQVQQEVTTALFMPLIRAAGRHIFELKAIYPISSDSSSMYLLMLILMTAAVIFAAIAYFSHQSLQKFRYVIRLLACYYLAFFLFKYGMDKVLGNQFYSPYPNTLFTPIGNVEKDLLYWTTMGSSPLYSMFLGAAEIIAAILILINKTRRTGLVISAAIILNIVAINFGFDISVKLFSLFLLFLCVLALTAYRNEFYRIFISSHSKQTRRFGLWWLKWAAILFIVVETVYPFVKNRNTTVLDNHRYLEGAYEVNKLADTLVGKRELPKRIFIHPGGFLIVEDADEVMRDWKLEIRKDSSWFVITDYQHRQRRVPFIFDFTDSSLMMGWPLADPAGFIHAKRIEVKRLPLFKKGIHWTVD